MANSILSSNVNKIIFACEAGMGSSLMGVNSLKKKFKKANILNIEVVHKPTREIPEDAQLIVVHQGLAKMVKDKASNAVVVAFKQFINDPVFDNLVVAFSKGEEIRSNVD